MPRLSCWSCGRQIYTVTPLDSLFAEERRCPRCGAFLKDERRDSERRSYIRREKPAGRPAPPIDEERRLEDRRTGRRRKTQDASGLSAGQPADTASSGRGGSTSR
jgi:hypothetical protein